MVTERLSAALSGRYRIESGMMMSRDGKLPVMTSSETGGNDVWTRDYPVPQGKWRVSSNELSSNARWSPDGNYVYSWRGSSAAPDTLYRARIERRTGVTVHPPERVLAMDLPGAAESWDLHPDGKRIAVIVNDVRTTAATGTTAVQASRYLVVQNWFSDLKRLTSGARR